MLLLYRTLRFSARMGLRWFYRRIEVAGTEQLPLHGPVILAANHANALVDALIVGCHVPREVRLTAKATLLDHPATRWVMRAVGIIPLRRARDERARLESGGAPAPERNLEAFDAAADALHRGEALLIFPEGISHSAPELAPLRTGAARIALHTAARHRRPPPPLFPVGITFERKWQPRTRVFMLVGPPIGVAAGDEGVKPPEAVVAAATERLNHALRAVTLNFPSEEDANRVLRVAQMLSLLENDVRPLGDADPLLEDVVRRARQLEELRRRLPSLHSELRAAVDVFLQRLDAFEQRVHALGARVNDLNMSTSVAAGARFVLRELGLVVLLGPVALWGRVNHFIPLRLAWRLARKTSRTPDEPAMRTLVSGFVLVLIWYILTALVVGALFGWWWAPAFIASAVWAAEWDFRMQDRIGRAVVRARTYLLLRRQPELRRELLATLQQLRVDLRWLRSQLLA